MSEYSINIKIRSKINLCLFIISLFVGIAIEVILNFIVIKSIEGNVFFILLNVLVLPSTYGIYELLRLWMVKDLWKRKIFRKFIGIPNLNGKWHAEGKSDYNGGTNFNGDFTICQTLDKIKISGSFSTSKSTNTLTYLHIDEDGSFELSYYYDNRPLGEEKHTMQIHNGFVTLTNENNGSMLGEYFTNRFRGNKGTIKLTR